MTAGLENLSCPHRKPFFKINLTIVEDIEFKSNVTEAVNKWIHIKDKFNYQILDFWELIVKPGIRKIAISRTKELNKSKRGVLNLLYLRQSFLI